MFLSEADQADIELLESPYATPLHLAFLGGWDEAHMLIAIAQDVNNEESK